MDTEKVTTLGGACVCVCVHARGEMCVCVCVASSTIAYAIWPHYDTTPLTHLPLPRLPPSPFKVALDAISRSQGGQRAAAQA